MKKILICGATGFIGRNLINYFLNKKSYKVFATFNNKKPFDSSEFVENVSWIKANLLNQNDVVNALKNKDIVIQAAATTSGSKDIIQRPYIHVTDNAIMNSLLLRESLNTGIEHFIFFSCSIMYQSSDMPIKEDQLDPRQKINQNYFGAAHTKLYIEKMLDFYSRISDMKTTAIRHSNVYGPFDKFDLEKSHVFGASLTKVMSSDDEIIVWGDGQVKRDLIHVHDLCRLVDMLIKLQESKFKVYNCGSGNLISVKELLEKMIKASQKDLKLIFDCQKPSINSSILLDYSLVRQEIGWYPEVSLEQGIKDTMKWWNDNINPDTLQLARK